MSIGMIQPKRLADYFITLCEIDSPGKQERNLAMYLTRFFSQFPRVIIEEDDSSQYTGSDTGNLIVTIPGNDPTATAVFFNCHMDVINPCLGVEVDFTDDVFTSKGDTVLGGDDKAGIAILMELTHILMEFDLSHPMVQFILTTGEEIGLRGAKHLDRSLILAEYGFALDSTGIDNGIVGAPAAVYVEAVVTGRAAHAGLNPEDGINAIVLCSEVISRLPLGRIDAETTANIGHIEGGSATNIIPERVRVRGEIRCHSQAKLTQTIVDFKRTFVDICVKHGGRAEVSFPPQYPGMLVDTASPVVQRLKKSASALKRDISLIVAGGGSDANVFNSRGLPTVILGTGMADVHSTSENISLSDITRTTELALSVVTC
ncbi:MAG: M20/M25/M40 family metallo-hydrolase [Spirochaetales bacterium]|jgi:tripeptide aminopeptidase|nr:M20/M25/M40 family metallo-hydrolase [Spirochaetales bacterium]